jgi:hypothetical protein
MIGGGNAGISRAVRDFQAAVETASGVSMLTRFLRPLTHVAPSRALAGVANEPLRNLLDVVLRFGSSLYVLTIR